MRNVLKLIGLCLKLALLVALLVGAVFLVKTGIKLLNTDATSTPIESSGIVETEYTVTDPNVTFEEIYKAYKSNKLVAEDQYKNNRYRITATINGMETGGLLNLTGGATLTMETKVGNTIVFFTAEFEQDQEEALKKVVVKDTIVFEGTCLSAGSWTDCIIVE